MADCDKFRMQFSDYLDGELTITERTELEAHLAVCEYCSETLNQIRIIQRSLQNIPAITTSPDFETRLHQMLHQQQTRSFFPFRSLQGWKVPAMGSALVLASLGLFLVFNHGSDNQPTKRQYIPAATQIASPASRAGFNSAPPPQVQPIEEKEIVVQDSMLNEDSVQINHREVQFITGH